MANAPHDGEPGDETEQLGGHAARAAGERLREIAEAEHARVEAEEAAGPTKAASTAPAASSADEVHPLAGLAEPINDENLILLGPAAAGMAPCPFCAGYGAVDPDQLIAALPNVIEALAPYPTSTVFVRCDECDGWGSVLTGGRTGDNGIQPCPKCSSHGYIDTRETTAGNADRADVQPWPPRPSEFQDGDPFTLAPPEGVPPAAGMEWDADVGRWQYPARVA